MAGAPVDSDAAATPTPRAVAAGRGAAWYSEGLALFRQAPFAWVGLGVFTIACQLAMQAIPELGSLLDKVLMPLIGAGLLIAAAAATRRERPALRHLLSVFAAPPGAQFAIVVSGLIVFAVEAWVVHALSGANLLALDEEGRYAVTAGVLLAAFAAGVLASLPFAFVPLLALFAGRGPLAAFRESALAFRLNVLPMLSFGAIGLALLAVGLATMGIGLAVVFPLWATATWAAWKDIFR